MSLTVATIQTDLNTYIGDTSTDRISAAERLEFITEATIWLQEELKNDHMVRTYALDYIDTVNYYQVTTPLADLLEGADLRRVVGKNYFSMAHKSSREMAEDISQRTVGDDSWSIERRDNIVLLAINAVPQNRAIQIEDWNGGVDGWTADTVTSDASNVVWDQNEAFQDSVASLSFDIVVGQSSNNRATITNTTLTNNLSTIESTGVFLLDAFITDSSHMSSYTLFWGTDSSNYWTSTVTTNIDGNAFANGWQTLAFDWATASKVGSPSSSAITYYRIDMNYTAAQTSNTKNRYDSFRVAKPETLTFYYASFYVGTDTTGVTELLRFAATTDIPFFSGKYDQYRKAVSHMAASICFDTLRLKDDAIKEEARATKALERVRRIYPQSITKEVKSFKVQGINLSRPSHIRSNRMVN